MFVANWPRAKIIFATIALLNLATGKPTAWAVETPALLTTLDEVLLAYTDANGGLENIRKARSIRLEGENFQNEEGYNFILIKKRPHFIRLIMKKDETAIHLGYNGVHAWQMIEAPGVRRVEDLSGPSSLAFVRDSAFESPLINAAEEGISLKLDGVENVNRVDCYRIRVKPADQPEYFIYLDSRTFRETFLKRDIDGADGRQEYTTWFLSYLEVENIWLAVDIENRLDGKVIGHMTVDSAEINIGVLNSYFSRPQALSSKSSL